MRGFDVESFILSSVPRQQNLFSAWSSARLLLPLDVPRLY